MTGRFGIPNSILANAVLTIGISLAPVAQARSTPGSAAVPFQDFAPGGGGGSAGSLWNCAAESIGHLRNTCSNNIVEEIPLPVDVPGSYTPTFSLSNNITTQCIVVAVDQTGAIVGNTGWNLTSQPGTVSVPTAGALYGACEIPPNQAIVLVNW